MMASAPPDLVQRHVFLTVRPQCGGSLLEEVGRIKRAVRAMRGAVPLRVDAWVVLPDHFHAVCAIGSEGAEIEFCRQRLLHDLAATGSGPLRETLRRADLLSRDLPDMVTYADAVRRCWFDPVRHEVARRPEDWAHSSIHAPGTTLRMVA